MCISWNSYLGPIYVLHAAYIAATRRNSYSFRLGCPLYKFHFIYSGVCQFVIFLHFLCCFFAQCCHHLSICKPASTQQYMWTCIHAFFSPSNQYFGHTGHQERLHGLQQQSAALQTKSATWCQAVTINVLLLSITIVSDCLFRALVS